MVLSDYAIVTYKVDNYYNFKYEAGIKYNCNKIKNLGLDVCHAIRNGNVIQGMNRKELIWSMGNPDDIDETVYKTKTKAYYFYKSYITRQHKTRYRFRVDLENDVVVGWKDLD